MKSTTDLCGGKKDCNYYYVMSIGSTLTYDVGWYYVGTKKRLLTHGAMKAHLHVNDVWMV